MKLIVFDETSLDKPVVTQRPDYFSRADDKTDTDIDTVIAALEEKPVKAAEPEVEDVDVPDSDDDDQ